MVEKYIYAMNNTIILDHHGLFIYIDTYYPKTYYEHFATLEHYRN
jgi:hypothetical protein